MLISYPGGSPKTLRVFDSNSRVRSKTTLFRTADDFFKLKELCKHVKRVAIIGGGFLGSELACALGNQTKDRDLEVVQIFKEKGNMGKILPEYLSDWTTEKVRRNLFFYQSSVRYTTFGFLKRLQGRRRYFLKLL